MTTISGFTFIHNAIESGYPILEAIRAVQPYVDEVVIVDMQSTDETRDILLELPKIANINEHHIREKHYSYTAVKVINGEWGNQAGETLRKAHSLYKQCAGDIIIHFEADEVYDNSLIKRIVGLIQAGHTDLAVYRLQLEQNFQRCRWYPEPVHRVFPRLSDTRKEGHTTNRHNQAFQLEPKSGYLWDITNCFRDNWLNRVRKQAELRNDQPQYLLTPIHTLHKSIFTEDEARFIVGADKIWTMTNTPFAIPEILRPLVGRVKYEPKL